MSAVAVEPQIIKTKIYPPRLPQIVARERLLTELEDARSAKLVAIVAGAGYGKSTLAAEWLHKTGAPFVWYQLEDTDSDLSLFLTYLVAGLRDINPIFGERTLAQIASTPNVAGQSRAVLSTFIGELDGLIGEELFIALDDFHLVNDSGQITAAVSFLLDPMLPNLHFIILSRSALAMPLAELKARRELLELSESDLAFTPEETAKLFSDVFGMPLTEKDIAGLSASMEGWISGLVLFYLALKNKVGSELGKTVGESRTSLVFDYLSNAVYNDQPEEVKDFITKTSILSRLNPRFCDELLGSGNAQEVFGHLIDERLFTIPLDDHGEWYRYHFGLQSFLQNALASRLAPENIKELHLGAAALWDKRGEPEQAMLHYMEAGAFGEAADVLQSFIAELVRDSRISFLERQLARLPEDVLEKHPKLWIQRAQIEAMLGDYDTAVATASDASDAFQLSGDADGEAQSLLFSAAYRFSMAQPDEAERLTRRVMEIARPSSEPLWDAMALESTIRAGEGDDETANGLAQEALANIENVRAPRTRVRVLNWCGLASFLQGRFNKALAAFLDADALLEGAGPSATRAFVYALLSRTYTFLGRLQEARETARKGIVVGESLGFTPMSCLCRAARAVASAYSGDREATLADVNAAEPQCLGFKASGEAWYTHWFLGEAYLLLDDNDSARRHLKAFEQMAGKLPWVPLISKIASAACSLEDLGLEKAVEEMQTILKSPEKSAGIAVSLARSVLLRLRSQGGEEAEARDALATYIDDFGEDIVLLSCTTDAEFLLAPFTDLFSEGKHLEFMKRVYETGGAKSIPHLKRLEKAGGARVARTAGELLKTISRETVEPLSVKTLGPFRASVGGRAIPAKAWKSKKALTILKYLAANRDRGAIPRDVLMELIWPEAPLESSQKNLNAALSSLRKTLEPEAGRGESSYLLSKGEALSLELGPGGSVDVDLLREKISGAARAREIGDFDLYFHALKEAAELYEGDFCSEDLYEDWCSQEREALKNDFMRLLINLSTEYLRRGEFEQALGCLEQAIAKDPGREDVYRQQMTICSQAGNRAGIEEAYRRCQRYLADNYDVSPSPETTELYQKLRQ